MRHFILVFLRVAFSISALTRERPPAYLFSFAGKGYCTKGDGTSCNLLRVSSQPVNSFEQ